MMELSRWMREGVKDLTLVECARAWSWVRVVRERPHPCGPDETLLPDWLAIH